MTDLVSAHAAPVGNLPANVVSGFHAQPRRPLRICMIHYSDFALDSRVQRHAYALAERGDEVHAICLSARDEIKVGEGRVRLHPVGSEKARADAISQLGGYARFCTGAALKLNALRRSARFDVVEAHNMPNAVALAALGAKVAGTPVILDVHDTFPELFETKFGAPGRPFLSIVRAEERLSAAAADAVICVTQQARARLASRGVRLEKSHVVMNSPDEGVFGPPRAPVLIPSGGPVRAIYHGGIAPRFGVEPLIRGFGLLQQTDVRVRLDIHGSFQDFDELAHLEADLSPKRVFIAQAPTPFREIPRVLSDKHIGIVPTLSDKFTELPLPVKLLEYVHMGIPVIASRLPAIEKYFSEGELKLVPPGSPGALADAVRELCAEPEAAAARAVRATKRLSEMRWSRQREVYLRLVDRLAAEHRLSDVR